MGSGEHVIAGCGELHVEICLKDLKEEYAQCDLVISDPVVGYRETVTADSKTALAKSPNKHNRLYLVATPMSEELAAEIEKGPAGPKADPKDRVKLLEKSSTGMITRRARFGAGVPRLMAQMWSLTPPLLSSTCLKSKNMST